jgi:hypothetical protein
MVSFQLGKGRSFMRGAISFDRGPTIRIRNHYDRSCDFTAGKNFTGLVEITPHLRKVPEVNFRPVIHRTPGGIIFESATSKPI